jgi:hypothetical protein
MTKIVVGPTTRNCIKRLLQLEHRGAHAAVDRIEIGPSLSEIADGSGSLGVPARLAEELRLKRDEGLRSDQASHWTRPLTQSHMSTSREAPLSGLFSRQIDSKRSNESVAPSEAEKLKQCRKEIRTGQCPIPRRCRRSTVVEKVGVVTRPFRRRLLEEIRQLKDWFTSNIRLTTEQILSVDF